MMRKIMLLMLTLLAMAAAFMARRALKRGTGDYAALIAGLWVLAGQIAMTGTANTAKARATEARLTALVPRIPVQQTAPGTTASGTAGTTNTSYGITGQNTSTPDGNSGSTWATGERDYINYLVNSVGVLFGAFNALQASYSNTIPALNNVASDHSQLVNDHNNLKAALTATGILH
jgi:hypothetical protein